MNLASDPIWSVRKAIAEQLAAIGEVMSSDVRHTSLLDLIRAGLQDESRWVKKSTHQVFGPFLVMLDKERIGAALIRLYKEKVLADNELYQACAYNLAALAQHIGPARWLEVRELFEIMVDCDQWKVRKAMAYSLHEFASLVGPEQTEAFLMPLFEGYLKDLQDVKLGAVVSLSKFISHLEEAPRARIVTSVVEALKEEHLHDWRFREVVSGELVEVVKLFPAETVHEYLVPIGMRLWNDEVAQVRTVSAAIPGALYARMRGFPPWENEIMQACLMAGKARGWLSRQMFVATSKHMVEQIEEKEVFQERVLPHLLRLQDDRVVNVRLALAEALTVCLSFEELLELPELGGCVERLLRDEDCDVRDAADRAMAVIRNA